MTNKIKISSCSCSCQIHRIENINKLKKRIEDKNKTRRKKKDKIEELLLETGQTDKRVHVCGSCLLNLSIQFDLKIFFFFRKNPSAASIDF
jgi:hypothetical protein